jgi:hypothetical protein
LLRVVLAATLFYELFIAVADVIFPDHSPVFLVLEHGVVLHQVVVERLLLLHIAF